MDARMAWKKRFAPTMFIGELADIGPFKIVVEPENLGKGKYRARLVLKDGSEKQITTYEGTIGNILRAQGSKGYCVAFESKELSKTTGRPYINFKPANSGDLAPAEA